VFRCTGTGSRSYFRGRRRAGGPRAYIFPICGSCGRGRRAIRGSMIPTDKKVRDTPRLGHLTLNLMTFDISEHGRTVRSMRPSVRHPRIHTKSRHAADRSLQSLWFVDAREPQPVPSPSGQRHSATVVNCRLVQQYIRSSDLEPDSKRLPCHVPRSTGCSSRMRDEYMYDMMNCDELLARTHQ